MLLFQLFFFFYVNIYHCLMLCFVATLSRPLNNQSVWQQLIQIPYLFFVMLVFCFHYHILLLVFCSVVCSSGHLRLPFFKIKNSKQLQVQDFIIHFVILSPFFVKHAVFYFLGIDIFCTNKI